MWFSKNNPSTSLRTGERIYLDYASATPVCEAALAAYNAASALIGNPGAIHTEGVEAKRVLERSRESIAAEIGCKAREIVFTSGGTEANNLAILGFARALEISGRSDLPTKISHISDEKPLEGQTFQRSLAGTHWVVSAIEHPSVLECFAEIERLGGEVTHVDPDARGIIMPEAVSRALRPNTVFVSIGWGNGEIGTIQPLAQIARIIRDAASVFASATKQSRVSPQTPGLLRSARKDVEPGMGGWPRIVFHTDAGQAPLYRALQVHSLGVDLLTLDSGKLYGPRGIGALFVGKDAELAPIILGGKQERGLRAGTENVALAAGFAAALTQVAGERASEAKRLEKLRDDFAREIVAQFPASAQGSGEAKPGVVINGDLDHAMPHMLNISIPSINSEYLVLALDHAGIALSTKSACREGEASRSHVVEALPASRQGLGGEPWRSQSTLRFSLGRSTTQEQLTQVVEVCRLMLHRHMDRA